MKYAEPGPASQTATASKSSGVPQRRRGIRGRILAFAAEDSSRGSVIAAMVQPGTRALTRMSSRASSTASARAIATRALLAAA